jgi:hypothetical protein
MLFDHVDRMNCPQCQKELPENQKLIVCPTCGCTLPKITNTLKTIAILLGRVLLAVFLFVLVLVGIALLIMAVIFAGCVLVNGGRL